MRALLVKLFPGRFLRPSRDTRARGELAKIAQAIEQYRHDNLHLPLSLEDLIVDPGEDGSWNGPYIEPRGRDTFLDPWGQVFDYRTDGETFEVESNGLLGYERDYG